MRARVLSRVLPFLVVIGAACASHDYETYVAELDGALEGVTTPARGRAIVLVSRRGDRAEVSLTISGVRSAILGSFVRQASRGQSGSVVLTLWVPGQGPFDEQNPILRTWQRTPAPAGSTASGGVDRPLSGTDLAFDAGMLQALRSGSLYVNVQTRDRPSGEVRGQLLPE